MQTNNLSMQMLLQNQSSPDATLNENFLKIDSFIFGTAVDFTDSIPINPQNGEVYIFSSKFEKANHIGFFTSNKGWKFFEPKLGLEFFVISHKCKYSLTSEGWGISTTDKQNADWNATSGFAQILNKPTIPTLPTLASVATSGSYNDLTNKPTLFDGSYTSLTNKPTIPTVVDQNYIGDFKTSAQTVNHGRWLLCNGQVVSRLTYSALFAIIGVTFGTGDGATTFTLPDCRGRVNASIGQGVGLTKRTSGQVVGAETHTLSTDEMPSHSHNLFGGNSGGMPPARSSIVGNAGVGDQIIKTGLYKTNNLSSAIDATGGGLPHNNMQPTIFLGNTFIYAGV